MEYGLIGERLGHSFSAVIHGMIGKYGYTLREIPRGGLERFIRESNFLGLNVTIPYKQEIMPLLDEIDTTAKDIGAVNTVVRRGDKLYGYNTDFDGMCGLAKHAGVNMQGKKVLILGTGGTSLTARAVARSLGCREVYRVSRSGRDGAVTYEQAYAEHGDADIIINTTPCGMLPGIYSCPIRLEAFSRLSGVLDAIYNPLRTTLVQQAQSRGIPAEGGLYMLVCQAIAASELFTGEPAEDGIAERIYSALLAEKENIVLIGMPGCGKSTVGSALAKQLGRKLIDTDTMITEATGMTPSEIFEQEGESGFRCLESEAVRKASAETGCIIATGGGAVLRRENVDARCVKTADSTTLIADLSRLSRPPIVLRRAVPRRYGNDTRSGTGYTRAVRTAAFASPAPMRRSHRSAALTGSTSAESIASTSVKYLIRYIPSIRIRHRSNLR